MLEVGRQHLLSSLHLSWNRNVIVQAVANNFNVLLKCFSVFSPVNTSFFFLKFRPVSIGPSSDCV